MSKEQEAYAQQTCDPPPISNPQPANAYPGQTYNSILPGQYTVPGPVSNHALPSVVGTRLRPEPKKSLLEAYLLWLVLGPLGAHHFYLRRPGFGVLYFFTFGLAGCGYLIDLFRMPYLVKRANKTEDRIQGFHKRNISDAYTLWFPFGLLGFHHFYLNNPGFGVLYFFTFGLFGLGWLVDLFRIPSLVRKANEETDGPPMKTKCTAYLLGIPPCGILGAHHFYLNRPIFGMFYFLTFGNFGIGWLVDLIRMPWLVERTNKEIKSRCGHERYLDDAYLLWFPFGLIGLHHFYLNRPLWGLVYFCTFGLFGIGWLIDGCRMACLVRDCNTLTEERTRIPTTYTLPPSGIGYPVVQPTVNPTMHNGYNAPVHFPAAFHPGTNHPQAAYQYPQQQVPRPSYMEQPPPYSPLGGAPVAEHPPAYSKDV